MMLLTAQMGGMLCPVVNGWWGASVLQCFPALPRDATIGTGAWPRASIPPCGAAGVTPASCPPRWQPCVVVRRLMMEINDASVQLKSSPGSCCTECWRQFISVTQRSSQRDSTRPWHGWHLLGFVLCNSTCTLYCVTPGSPTISVNLIIGFGCQGWSCGQQPQATCNLGSPFL